MYHAAVLDGKKNKKNMQVIKTFRNVTVQGETNNSKSKTIPEQTLSVRQIVARQGIGLLDAADNTGYYNDTQIDTIRAMDRLEKIDFLRDVNDSISELKRTLSAQKDARIKQEIRNKMATIQKQENANSTQQIQDKERGDNKETEDTA